MLEAENVKFRYSHRQKYVLDGIGFSLKKGEIGVVLGKNGSGKTTLFKTILGIEKPESGSIRFEGSDLQKIKKRERARIMAYVPQNIGLTGLTVFDTVLMGRMPYFGLKASREDEKAVFKLLKDMGLQDLATRNSDELSGGEKQKVIITRALAQEPKLMIFDEPTGNLDIANEQLILKEAVRLSKEKNISILTSLHDLNQALEIGDRFFLMKEGKIRYFGGPEIINEETIKDIYAADIRIIENDGKKIILNDIRMSEKSTAFFLMELSKESGRHM